MSTPRQPLPAKLFVSVLSASPERIVKVLLELAGSFGELDFVSAVLRFDYTDYYHAEMGQPLYRRFASFDSLVQQEDLAEIKVQTNLYERKTSAGGNRTVNIDPGLLLAERFVLASGKNYVHRLYLSQGIYADLTLIYHDNDYQPLGWTYPDYADAAYHEFFGEVRRRLLEQLRS